jgi:hypothetical protein
MECAQPFFGPAGGGGRLGVSVGVGRGSAPGTAGTPGAAATGRGRVVPVLPCSRPLGRARGGMRGAMRGAVMAASP